MNGVEDFPYQAEYAKSSRAGCRGCKGNIEKGTLRLAVLVQSPLFDGKITHWYHHRCFFIRQRPKSVADIAQFDSLRWEDQQKIKEKIENGGSTPLSTKKGKGTKKVAKEFCVEYAKSGRAVCKKCEEKILKDQIRISKMNYDSDAAKRFGPVPMWHHIDCFLQIREELEFYDGAENIPGFNTLSADDKKILRGKIKKTATDCKRKAGDEPDTATKKVKSDLEEKMKVQNEKIFHFRDRLQKSLSKSEMVALLEHNDYFIPTGEDRILNLLCDLMTFGVPLPCSVCHSGDLIYKFGVGYKCYGNLTEWTKCSNIVDVPQRKNFLIPAELKKAHTFLKSYKFKDIGPRMIIKREVAALPGVSNKGANMERKPLDGMSFVLVGSKFTKNTKEMKAKILSLGGEVSTKVEKSTTAIITTADKLGGKDKKIAASKELNIQCVSEDFLDEVDGGGAVIMINKKNLAPWGTNPEERIGMKVKSSLAKSSSSAKSGSHFVKNMPDKMKLKLKDGAVVDPDSNLDDVAHVYQRNGKIYNSVLGYVDFAKGTNSYYKLQLIEHDNKRSWYVFRSWGRIGTTIGSSKLENCEDLSDAINQFNSLYEEKTGQNFMDSCPEKLPGYWYPLEIDYGQDKNQKLQVKVEGSNSQLPQPVQNLISLIFDVNLMQSALMEFEIDLKKMPLGKLSRRQLESSYRVLAEALEWIKKLESDGSAAKSHLLDCSNRFYTLIPHDFGMNMPPLLDTEAIVKNKIEMVDNLCEIEIAYSLLKSVTAEDKDLDPIDVHYKKLKTNIQCLDKESQEFRMIEKYIQNTHAATHSYYTLEISEVFKIEREGEQKRFKPFKKLSNHQLLWHGSRLTNFVGIISQGLRIAPPEAPVTGYMFGKGVYFADMVSKSANYCCANSTNEIGLLLLCQVALGEINELTNAKNIQKLPKGKHSVKGLGKTIPDPSEDFYTADGVKVPLGKGIPSGVKNSSLLYNEYIVYDTAQIYSKYLIQTKFSYK